MNLINTPSTGHGATPEGDDPTHAPTEPHKPVHPAHSDAPVRLASLDALRGFTMFWILGGNVFATAFHALPQNGLTTWMAEQMTHVSWAGFHFEDLIFPMFIFIAGASMVFALTRRVAQQGRTKTAWSIVRRSFTLYLLGVWYYGGIAQGFDHIRWVGVLQRIAFAYFCAGLLFLWLKPRGLLITLVGILLGYWALLAFVPVPGFGAGDYLENHNLTNYLDHYYLPGYRWNGDHDPEGLLSSLPAVATCIFGIFAGMWLRGHTPAVRKAGVLIAAGAALIALGWVWAGVFPLIKKIWTSSYALEAAGWSAVFLGVFYLLMDHWKIRRWAIPFVWIGLNPITLYLIESLMPSRLVAMRFVGGEIYSALDQWLVQGAGAIVLALVASCVSVGIAWFLHHHRIYLRV